MEHMKTILAQSRTAPPVLAALLAFVVSTVAWNSSTASQLGQSHDGDLILAQNSVQDKAPQAAVPKPAGAPPGVLSWTFVAPQPATGDRWTAERGTMTLGSGETRLQPDANRRVVLLSPPDLPEAARYAEEFVLGVSGTGLQRVRIQARRDARGGWITIADASGASLREVADGYAIKRNPGTRGASIERLRFELTFRTTNPRMLTRIVVR
jgi:hypothetical protein